MSQQFPAARSMGAPRATRILAEILALGVLAQAAFAGAFLVGHHMWLSWHQQLGDFIVIVPLASLVVGLVARRRDREIGPVLVTRVVLLALVIGIEATGHAAGSLLALHIPLAVATMALTMWQVAVAAEAQRASTPLSPVRAGHDRA